MEHSLAFCRIYPYQQAGERYRAIEAWERDDLIALAMLGTWLVALIRWLEDRRAMPRRRWKLSRASWASTLADAVPAGEHEIELRYEPTSLKVGLAISGFTGLSVLGIWLMSLDRWRRNRAGTAGRR